MTETVKALNLHEYQSLAAEILPKMYYEFVAGGAEDETTLDANRAAFARWVIIPRVLRGIQSVNTTTKVLGREVSLPVLLAPVALHRLVNDAGEAATAAAARDAGTIFTMSTLSSQTVEEVAKEVGDWWFQLYCYQDRATSLDLMRRAEAAGAAAILVTVDTPLLGRREADERNGFVPPPGMAPTNLAESAAAQGPAGVRGSGFAAYAAGLLHASLSWDDIDWIASQTNLPVGVKGVLSPEDGRIAAEYGAKVIVVSNHGGRQLDHSIAALDALPGVVEVVAGRCEVLVDGGIRRGTDVLKALALGAGAVMIGRPYMWGLTVGGRAGVLDVIEMLRIELELDMLLAGCADIASVNRDLIAHS